MRKTTKTDELEITVTRSWPLHNLKEVYIKRQGNIIRDDIELTPEQAEQLYQALADILDKKAVS